MSIKQSQMVEINQKFIKIMTKMSKFIENGQIRL